jgi:hypothetical protein
VSAICSRIFEQVMSLQGFDELADVAFSDAPAHFEFLADFVDDGGFGCPGLKKFEDPGSDEVEIEHLSLPDIQDNRAILAVRAADAL